MKTIPNLITALRLVLALLLFFITDNWSIFLIIYFLCGISDMLDGFIARHFHLQTKIGARFDSLSDFVFFSVSFLRMLLSYHLTIPVPVVYGAVGIALVRLVNLFITIKKFKQPGMLHTYGNKISGIIVFFACPLAVMIGSMSMIILLFPFIFALEETIILLRTDFYDPDIKSFYSIK